MNFRFKEEMEAKRNINRGNKTGEVAGMGRRS
jgi:hypothetical protein